MSSDWEDLFERKSQRNHSHKHDDSWPPHERYEPACHHGRHGEDDSGFHLAQPKHGHGYERAVAALLASPRRGLWIALGLGLLLVALLVLLGLLIVLWPLLRPLVERLWAADWTALVERLRSLLPVLPGN